MSIQTEDVKMVAELSMLNFTDKELEQMKVDLNAVIDYAEELKSVDTSFASSANQKNKAVYRQDKEEQSIPRELLLASAPKTDGTSFVVPKVVD